MLALDLDETTLNENGVLSDFTRRTLEEAVRSGVILVAASGRSYASLPDEIKRFPGIRYAVVSNGAAVAEMTTGRLIRQLHIPEESAEKVLNLIQTEADIVPELCIDGQMYAPEDYVGNPQAFRRSPYVAEYVRRTRKAVADIREFFNAHRNEIESMDLICPDPEKKPFLEEKVRRTVPELYVTSSVPQMVELAHPEAGKGKAVAFLADKEGIKPENIMAVGNADNDIDMLQFAGLGIAVQNATPGCLAAADEVTASHKEDGAAQAVRKYLLQD